MGFGSKTRTFLEKDVPQKHPLVALIHGTIFAFSFVLGATCLLDPYQLRAFFFLRGREVPSSAVVVRVDDRSLNRLNVGGSDIPTRYVAEAIETATAGGARLIFLDIFYSQRTRDTEGDERLRRAIAAGPVVLGRGVTRYLDTALDGTQRRHLDHNTSNSFFRSGAKGNATHLVRKVGGIVWHMSLATDEENLEFERSPFLKYLRQHVSPLIAEPSDLDIINYYGPPYSIPDVPLYQLIGSDRTAPENFFRDRVVLIGVVDFTGGGASAHDVHMTPTSREPMAGVEVLANIMGNLVENRWLRRLPATVELGVEVLCVCHLVMCASFLGLRKGSMLLLIAMATALALSFMCFIFFRLFISVLPLACTLLVALGYLFVDEVVALSASRGARLVGASQGVSPRPGENGSGC